MTRLTAQSPTSLKTDLSTTSLKSIEQEARRVLYNDGIIVFPTETFYGLAVQVQSEKALCRLAELKGDRGGKSFPLIVDSVKSVATLACIPDELQPFVEAFWPGPLSLSLQPKVSVPSQVLSPRGELGVRVSSHQVAHALATWAGGCITATSANSAGLPPAYRCDHLSEEILSGADLIIDAGLCPGGKPSTIIGLREGAGVIWRLGAISKEDLDEVRGLRFEEVQT